MSYKCNYINCDSSRGNCVNVHFFKFPTNEFHQKLWINLCGNVRLCDVPSEQLAKYIVCEKHFEEKYIIKGTKYRLMRNALPKHYEVSTNNLQYI